MFAGNPVTYLAFNSVAEPLSCGGTCFAVIQRISGGVCLKEDTMVTFSLHLTSPSIITITTSSKHLSILVPEMKRQISLPWKRHISPHAEPLIKKKSLFDISTEFLPGNQPVWPGAGHIKTPKCLMYTATAGQTLLIK